MVQKFIIQVGIVLFCLLIYIIPVFSQTDMKQIEDKAFENPQRPPVVFNHDSHNQKAQLYDCSICHHVYKNGERVPRAMSVGQKCSDCHQVKGNNENKIGLMNAYHKQCIECHQTKNKGPMACGECHVKK